MPTAWNEKKATDYLKDRATARGLTLHSVWKHWKTGNLYQIVLFSLDEKTLAPLVHYQSLEHPETLPWSREATVFLENVKNGLDWVARFRREDA
jgi:hypothetical protein